MPRSTPEQLGWYLYDFANSAFPTTVVTLFLGPYLTSIAKAAAGADGMLHPLGIPVDPRSFWSYNDRNLRRRPVSVSAGNRRAGRLWPPQETHPGHDCLFWRAPHCGAVLCPRPRNYLAGGSLFIVANVSFGAAEAIYNSFLPEIASPEERDSVSSKGWATGYLGGGLLLALNVILYMKAASLGLTEAMAVRISLSSAGLWWAVFTIPTLRALRDRGQSRVTRPGLSAMGAASRQLIHTLRDLRRYPQALTFLIAFLHV